MGLTKQRIATKSWGTTAHAWTLSRLAFVALSGTPDGQLTLHVPLMPMFGRTQKSSVIRLCSSRLATLDSSWSTTLTSTSSSPSVWTTSASVIKKSSERKSRKRPKIQEPRFKFKLARGLDTTCTGHIKASESRQRPNSGSTSVPWPTLPTSCKPAMTCFCWRSKSSLLLCAADSARSFRAFTKTAIWSLRNSARPVQSLQCANGDPSLKMDK